MHMLRTVSVHMVGHNQPSPREAKGFGGFRAGAWSSELEVQGDKNQRISLPSSSQIKIKKSVPVTLS